MVNTEYAIAKQIRKLMDKAKVIYVEHNAEIPVKGLEIPPEGILYTKREGNVNEMDKMFRSDA